MSDYAFEGLHAELRELAASVRNGSIRQEEVESVVEGSLTREIIRHVLHANSLTTSHLMNEGNDADEITEAYVAEVERWIRSRNYSLTRPKLCSQCKKMVETCLLYTSPSPRDRQKSRMPSSA